MTQDFLALPRAVARFFVTGSIIANAEGVGGMLSNKIFKFGDFEMLLSALEICLRKIDLEDENGKQLQITIIKIKLNRSGEGGQLHLPYGSVSRRLDIHIDCKLLIEGVVV